MVPLVVDPQALFAVGSAVIAAGEGLAANLTVLTAGFAAHTGLDAAGAVFGLAYQDAGESVLQAATAAVNACRQSGALIQQGAANYSQAEAASTLGGGAGALQAAPAQAKMSAPGPPGTWGKGEPPPLLWAVVESFVDDVWPDGDVAGLHAAAARWRGPPRRCWTPTRSPKARRSMTRCRKSATAWARSARQPGKSPPPSTISPTRWTAPSTTSGIC
ncbi:hypothetical protein [Mycobacterium terramassiliense]|uniref:hypothetical protein n=1 Tax=Mycobacterium terramassiliense TaxID=1841859 RepID=UPI001C1FA85C|nr:hypothetical protein [Mycobacterium terramassiliense]